MTSRTYGLMVIIVLWAAVFGPACFKHGFDTGLAHGSEQDPIQDHLENIPPGFHSWTQAPGRGIYEGRFYPPDRHPYYRHPGGKHYLYPPYYPYVYTPYFEPEKPWYQEEQPIPAGRVFFLVEPIQAEAFVNGRLLQRHPDLSYEIGLLQGEHELEIKAGGFESYRRKIEIRGGEMIHLTIRLEPAAGR